METKEELKRKLEDLERKDAEAKRQKELQDNYEKFKNRSEDLIIGKAHCDIGISKIYSNWYSGRYFTIGNAISISGNCGTFYNARAPITSATHTYFHNVWTDKQKTQFQNALNKVAVKEALKIMSDLRCVLEIMGLQSDSFFKSYIYPIEKKDDIEKEIELERKKILDKYKDKEFIELIKIQDGWMTENEYGKMEKVPVYQDTNLSHSNLILYRYIFKHRPKLQNKFKETRFFKNFSERILK